MNECSSSSILIFPSSCIVCVHQLCVPPFGESQKLQGTCVGEGTELQGLGPQEILNLLSLNVQGTEKAGNGRTY